MTDKSKILGLFTVDKKTALELLKIFAISGSISSSMLFILLLLLWHWQYYLVFKIVAAIVLLDYLLYAYFISKLFSKVIKIK